MNLMKTGNNNENQSFRWECTKRIFTKHIRNVTNGRNVSTTYSCPQSVNSTECPSRTRRRKLWHLRSPTCDAQRETKIIWGKLSYIFIEGDEGKSWHFRWWKFLYFGIQSTAKLTHLVLPHCTSFVVTTLPHCTSCVVTTLQKAAQQFIGMVFVFDFTLHLTACYSWTRHCISPWSTRQDDV